MSEKVIILAIDGTPFSFLQKMFSSGQMPFFASMVQDENNSFIKMNSVYPPVSSTAWASFMTGCTPDKHGILSFTERDPKTLNWFTPDARHLKKPAIWEILSERGKRVFVMNVPVTFPAKPVNGVSICGFLGNDLLTGTYPKSEANVLLEKGYRIDSNSELAKTDLKLFLEDLDSVLNKRIEVLWHYLNQGSWDFFMAHIMESDRLHHFTWELMDQGVSEFKDLYDSFYNKLDNLIAEVAAFKDDDTKFIILSDHGFTTLKSEVYINRWLWENDYLKFTRPMPESLHDIHPESKAYSLYPGRIFINLKGREKNGTVNPGMEFEILREEIKTKILRLSHPDDDQPIIKDIINGEFLYNSGKKLLQNQNDVENVADMVLIPHEGYDLKGQLWSKFLFSKSVFNGMHTFDNAFLFIEDQHVDKDDIAINDVANYIYKIMNIETEN